jgi:hydrogenase nickel incorporation protein HypA/HybF
MQNLFELVDTYSREYHLKKVSRVVIRVGELISVVPEALQFAFEVLSPDTVASGADLIIEHVPARSRCTVCRHEFASGFTIQVCPECGKAADFIEGRELYLQSLEGDQEEEEHGN